MKKTLKVILIVFGILFVLLTILVVKDLRVEAQLDEIVASLSESDKVDMDIKTTGEYAKIEKAIKIDYRDFYKLTSKLVKEYGNPVLENCLTASNFEKDGPKFLKTRAELEELKEARQQINGKMLKIVSEKEVNKKNKKI